MNTEDVFLNKQKRKYVFLKEKRIRNRRLGLRVRCQKPQGLFSKSYLQRGIDRSDPSDPQRTAELRTGRGEREDAGAGTVAERRRRHGSRRNLAGAAWKTAYRPWFREPEALGKSGDDGDLIGGTSAAREGRRRGGHHG